MEEQEQKEVIPKWFHCVPVMVEKVLVETTPKESKVFRVKLMTDLGDITYKPKKQIEEKSELGGFDTVTQKLELFTMGEFVTNNPLLKQLSDNCKKEPQEIILGYAEISRFDELEQEEVFYKYLTKGQFETIYYEKVHGKDKSNLKKQEEKKEKYNKKEL